MAQNFIVVELPHPSNGSRKRFQVSFFLIGLSLTAVLGLFLCTCAAIAGYFGFANKTLQYTQLRSEFDHLRDRYRTLQMISHQHNQQIVSLQNLANEVSVAYGITQPELGNDGLSLAYSDTTPTVPETVEEYNFLKAASFSSTYHQYAYKWQIHSTPSMWPVRGPIRSGFGGRSDPFSGEGAFHTGIDLAVVRGTPVHVTADGVVTTASWHTGYGKVVVVDHGNGFQTYYAHLSSFLVVPGQEVRLGQVIALSGSTGRSTGPHVHYEVRLHGTPVNPYRYMQKPRAMQVAQTQSTDGDFGL